MKQPSDIMFLMDQVALGQNGVGWATQFMSHIIDTEEMEVGMKVGILHYLLNIIHGYQCHISLHCYIDISLICVLKTSSTNRNIEWHL